MYENFINIDLCTFAENCIQMSAIDKQLKGSNFCNTECTEQQAIIHPETCTTQVLIDHNSTTNIYDWLGNTANGSFGNYTSMLAWLQDNYPHNNYSLPIASTNTLGGIRINPATSGGLRTTNNGNLYIDIEGLYNQLPYQIATYDIAGLIRLGSDTQLLDMYSNIFPETYVEDYIDELTAANLNDSSVYIFPLRLWKEQAGISIPVELFKNWKYNLIPRLDSRYKTEWIFDYCDYDDVNITPSIDYLNSEKVNYILLGTKKFNIDDYNDVSVPRTASPVNGTVGKSVDHNANYDYSVEFGYPRFALIAGDGISFYRNATHEFDNNPWVHSGGDPITEFVISANSINSDWNALDGQPGYIENKPTIGTGTVTLRLNGSNIGSFTLNSTSSTIIDIPSVYTAGEGIYINSSNIISNTIATASTIGGIKLGYLPTDNLKRPIVLDSNNKAYVDLYDSDYINTLLSNLEIHVVDGLTSNHSGNTTIVTNGDVIKPDLHSYIQGTDSALSNDADEKGRYLPVKLDLDAKLSVCVPSSFTPEPVIGTLNTINTTSQVPNSNESFSSTINLHKISKTGDYNDLLNLPTIGNGTVTLRSNGSNIGSFTLNSTSNTTIDLPIIAQTQNVAFLTIPSDINSLNTFVNPAIVHIFNCIESHVKPVFYITTALGDDGDKGEDVSSLGYGLSRLFYELSQGNIYTISTTNYDLRRINHTDITFYIKVNTSSYATTVYCPNVDLSSHFANYTDIFDVTIGDLVSHNSEYLFLGAVHTDPDKIKYQLDILINQNTISGQLLTFANIYVTDTRKIPNS